MTGVVLLYVGVVLIVNGIWLVGQAYAAAAASRTPAMETAAAGRTVRGGGYAGEAAAGQELGGEAVAAPPPRGAEASPLFIQNREVAILNIFTGFVGVAIAVTFIVDGGTARIPAVGLVSIRNGGAILLFAFTYLWVAYNQYANAGGRALGWYSLFVAVTAIVFGIYTVQNTPDSNTADLWLAGNWFAWAVLWAMFWALLSLELPIARITGWVAILEGFGTAWALSIALLWGKLAFALSSTGPGPAGGNGMEVLAMGLHTRERRKLRQIEEGLRKDDPALATLLGGRPPLRRRAPHVEPAWALTPYLVPPALLLAGLLVYAAWLVLAGGALCPFIPVIIWLLVRRHLIYRELGRDRKP